MTHQKSESPKAQRTTAEALGNSISFLIPNFSPLLSDTAKQRHTAIARMIL